MGLPVHWGRRLSETDSVSTEISPFVIGQPYLVTLKGKRMQFESVTRDMKRIQR